MTDRAYRHYTRRTHTFNRKTDRCTGCDLPLKALHEFRFGSWHWTGRRADAPPPIEYERHADRFHLKIGPLRIIRVGVMRAVYLFKARWLDPGDGRFRFCGFED